MKPTYTTKMKRKLAHEDFPEILLCPEPAIDVEALNRKGYAGVAEYFYGVSGFVKPFIGWAGNRNNSEDVSEVIKDISTLKTTDDCPLTYHSLIWSKGEYTTSIYFNLTRALYPYHRCCRIITPKLSMYQPIFGVHIALSNSSSLKFKMFLADKLIDSYFDLHKARMLGDKIVSGEDDSFITYKIQILEDISLDDPRNPCIDYKVKGEYGGCIEKEMRRQNSKFLNCTPPWMTDNRNLWCEGFLKNNITGKSYKQYTQFIEEIMTSDGNSGKCSVPCKLKRFEAREIGKKQRKDGFRGLQIVFEKEVKTTKSEWTISPLTLISKIGGFIGISKNFLWLIIMIMSSVGLLISKIKA